MAHERRHLVQTSDRRFICDCDCPECSVPDLSAPLPCICPQCDADACPLHAETPTPRRETAMPAPKPMTVEEHHRLSFHPATPETGPVHDHVRTIVRDASASLCSIVPDGRHRSLMLTALQESMMWANAAVACDTEAVQA